MTTEQRQNFVASFLKPKPNITVLDFKKQMNKSAKKANHEIFRNCPKCKEEWDAKKDGLNCPVCGEKGI